MGVIYHRSCEFGRDPGIGSCAKHPRSPGEMDVLKVRGREE